jgi:hypothetical protein
LITNGGRIRSAGSMDSRRLLAIAAVIAAILFAIWMGMRLH